MRDDGIKADRVYSVKEACRVLNIGATTFRLLMQRGQIKGRKVWRQWRFLGSELLKLVQTSERE